MKQKKFLTQVLTHSCWLFFLFALPVKANTIQIAVASNFATTIKELARQFESKTDHKVSLIFGSTGKHYAQIQHGAPFDAFLAADSKRPALLDKAGKIQPASRFTYAIGKLVLWAPQANDMKNYQPRLQESKFTHLAIANPKLAPYGLAAKQVLQHLKQWQALQAKIVRGENINQAFQFVKSGNAELGFVAYSQIKNTPSIKTASYWKIPQSYYFPIKQQAVLLKNNQVAKNFLAYLKSPEALHIIHNFGYGIP